MIILSLGERHDMKIYKRLYTSPKLVKKRTRIKWALKYNLDKLNIYIITLPTTDDQMEIFHCRELKQKYYDNASLVIIGIAESYDEAINLIQQILLDCYDKTGTYYIKNMFKR